jgi:hypothetical protein
MGRPRPDRRRARPTQPRRGGETGSQVARELIDDPSRVIAASKYGSSGSTSRPRRDAVDAPCCPRVAGQPSMTPRCTRCRRSRCAPCAATRASLLAFQEARRAVIKRVQTLAVIEKEASRPECRVRADPVGAASLCANAPWSRPGWVTLGFERHSYWARHELPFLRLRES